MSCFLVTAMRTFFEAIESVLYECDTSDVGISPLVTCLPERVYNESLNLPPPSLSEFLEDFLRENYISYTYSFIKMLTFEF